MNGSTIFFRRLALAGLFCFLYNRIVDARTVEIWDSQKLWDKSDLVVIAEPTANQNNDEAFEWEPELAQGISTTFKILACLKGSAPDKVLVLKHFIYKNIVPPNAGELINFLIGPLDVKVTYERNGKLDPWKYDKIMPIWLLFLKKRTDGSFIPVSGQIDPDSSFLELHGTSMFGTRYNAGS